MARDDRGAIRGALFSLRRDTGLPVAFGGAVADGDRPRGAALGGLHGAPTGPVAKGRGRLRISELVGTNTGALRGLTVLSGCGLGGKVMALGRPFAVSDYPTASVITHDYDAAVAAEDLHAIISVPVVVRRTVRAVLYCGTRGSVNLGDRVIDAAVDTARMLEQDLAIQDEIADRLGLIERSFGRGAATAAIGGRLAGAAGAPPGVAGVAGQPSAAQWEEVRAAYTELRLLAGRIDDAALRDDLLQVCDRLSGSAAPSAAEQTAGTRTDGGPIPARPQGSAGSAGPTRSAVTQLPEVRLTPRELDVLACVAAGCSNAETARRLGLRPETVKSYLREVMRKLDVHSRLEAVIAARRSGLLP